MVTPASRIESIALEFVTASERLFVNAPLYRTLSREVAKDAWLLELAAEARPEQPALLMLLGTVHYLVLRGAEHPLATLYARIAAGESDAEAPFPIFREFCRAFAEELRLLLRKGRVQTNEIGRTAYLRLGLEWTSAALGAAPIHYVEIGASAGINLSWDAFSMEFRREGEIALRRGPDGSPVRLSCDLGGLSTPSEQGAVAPRLEGRLGLEIDPPDLGRAEDRDWLLAFVWADHADRLQRMRGAIDLAASAHHPLIRADVTTQLVEACAAIPPGARICVAHTFLLSQLPPPALEALHGQMSRLAWGREVVQVGVEWVDHETQLMARRWAEGAARAPVLLARGDAHGRQIEWLASPDATGDSA
jgi:hypothetical protein